jgi:serine protease Do
MIVSFLAAVLLAIANSHALARGAPDSFADLAQRATPAVVNIATARTPETLRLPPGLPFDGFGPFGMPFATRIKPAPVRALGSGFIIDAGGMIVTNRHVIERASEITVTLSDGREFPARVIGQDELTDLAVLKVDAPEPLPYVSFGDSDALRVGDWVLAVGNPFGLGGSVTAGIVSARGRQIGSGPYDDFLQIDAPINQGNSGGPSFNTNGEVIGVNTAIFSPNGGSIGLGFAVPSSIAAPVVAELRSHGGIERGWIGIAMTPLAEEKRAPGSAARRGARIDEVQPGSPAARAGLRVGDIITAYRGQPITTPRQFAWAVAQTRAGERAEVTIERDGREMTRTVAIAPRPTRESRARGVPQVAPALLRRLHLEDPTQALA